MKAWPFVSRLVIVLGGVAAINLAGIAAAPSDDHHSEHEAPPAAEDHGNPAPPKDAEHAHATPAFDKGGKGQPTKPQASKPASPPDFQSYARGAGATESHGNDAPASAASPAQHVAPTATPAPTEDPKTEKTISSPSDALKMLMEANQRWIAGQPLHPHAETTRRRMLAESGQHPYATILTCSDSRLPAERIFDCGVGDIFVIRVAGNVMGPSETGTIEYGVEHLHTPLLVIMGHTKCGAVSAAVTDAHVGGSIQTLVDRIDPAVDRAAKMHPDHAQQELIPDAIVENVWQSIFDLLSRSEMTRGLVRNGKLQIVGAVCDIATGEVEWLGKHPWQSELIAAMSAEPAEPAVQTAGHDGAH